MIEALMPALLGEIAPAVAAETLAASFAPGAAGLSLTAPAAAGAIPGIPAATTAAAGAMGAAPPGMPMGLPPGTGMPPPPMAMGPQGMPPPNTMASIVQPGMGYAPGTQPPAPVETAGITQVNRPGLTPEQVAALAKFSPQQPQQQQVQARQGPGPNARAPSPMRFENSRMHQRAPSLGKIVYGG